MRRSTRLLMIVRENRKLAVSELQKKFLAEIEEAIKPWLCPTAFLSDPSLLKGQWNRDTKKVVENICDARRTLNTVTRTPAVSVLKVGRIYSTSQLLNF